MLGRRRRRRLLRPAAETVSAPKLKPIPVHRIRPKVYVSKDGRWKIHHNPALYLCWVLTGGRLEEKETTHRTLKGARLYAARLDWEAKQALALAPPPDEGWGRLPDDALRGSRPRDDA